MVMRVLSVLSQKGGTGKTTLSVNLAVAFQKAGLGAVIMDLDPQASSSQWGDSREEESPSVVSLHATRLKVQLQKEQKQGRDWVIIDTAPHSQRDALEAAQVADLILIPCKPSLIDLRAMSATLQIAELAQKPVLVVLTQTPPQSHLVQEAREAIEGYRVPLSPVSIGSRVAFVHAFTNSKSVLESHLHSKAASEIRELCSLIRKTLESL